MDLVNQEQCDGYQDLETLGTGSRMFTVVPNNSATESDFPFFMVLSTAFVLLNPFFYFLLFYNRN